MFGNHRCDSGTVPNRFRCRDLHNRATKRAKNIKGLLFPKSCPKQRRLVLSQRRALKGRKRMTRLGTPGASTQDNKYRKSAREPWLLATNLTYCATQVVTIYGYRMQIEENYRDAKNHRWGWSLRHAQSRTNDRMEVLLVLAALANVVVQGVGTAGENDSLQFQFQANTIRKRRVLSLFLLGRFLLKTRYRYLLSSRQLRHGFQVIPLKIRDIAAEIKT